MSEERSAFEQALDVLVYAPLGLVITAREELPRLIDKGRRRAGGQVTTARLMGQMAVAQGQKEAEKLARQAAERWSEMGLGAAANGRGSPPADPVGPARSAPVSTPAGTPSVSADDLAIPGYDALSAPQVVQRLDGLSPEELEAVRAYESATRHRRTILGRVAQLQQPPA